jgi:hypothetical protein
MAAIVEYYNIYYSTDQVDPLLVHVPIPKNQTV